MPSLLSVVRSSLSGGENWDQGSKKSPVVEAGDKLKCWFNI